MTTTDELNYYYFTVLDPDPPARSFGCVASSLDIAQRMARWAGYCSVLLLEARALEGAERPTLGRKQAIENPLVGADWLPLVELIATNMSLDDVDSVWSLEVATASDPLARNCPYAQILRTPDGGFHLEIGPTELLKHGSADNEALAEMLGWAPPEHRDLPNYSKTLEPATSFEYIAGTVIQALVAVCGMSVEDGFFIREGFQKLSPVAGIDMVDPGDRLILCDQLFGLAGRHTITVDALCEAAQKQYDATYGH